MKLKINEIWARVLTLSLTLILVSCGGAGILNAFNPFPKVNIDAREKSLSLQLGDAVRDTFIIPQSHLTREIHVNNWRQSIKSGFVNGFSNYFTIVDANPNLTIKLLKVDLSFGKTGTESSGGATSTTTYDIFGAIIVYQAQLIDAEGNILEKDYATANSKVSGVGIKEVTMSAVESMYEQISVKFFPVK